jgi:hypothetical protein
MLLATSSYAVQLKKRGLQMRVYDVAGNICQTLPARGLPEDYKRKLAAL